MIIRNTTSLFSLVLLSLLIFTACNHQPDGSDPEQSTEMKCPELISLFEQMDELEIRLESKNEAWENCTPIISEVTARIIKNRQTENLECTFLNQKQFPSKVRFRFVELMTEKLAIEGNIEAMRALFQLRMAFSQDMEVAEFIGEELGSVASRNPEAYLLLANSPETTLIQLAKVTLWNPLRLEEFITSYDSIEGGSEMAEYLKTL